MYDTAVPVLAKKSNDMRIAVNIGVDPSSESYPSSEYPIFIRISFYKKDNDYVASAIQKELTYFEKQKKAGFLDVSYDDVYSFFGYFKTVEDMEKLLEHLNDKELYDRLNGEMKNKVLIKQLINQAEKVVLNQAS